MTPRPAGHRGKVLVIGIGLLDVPNHLDQAVAELDRSREWQVT